MAKLLVDFAIFLLYNASTLLDNDVNKRGNYDSN